MYWSMPVSGLRPSITSWCPGNPVKSRKWLNQKSVGGAVSSRTITTVPRFVKANLLLYIDLCDQK